jgi:hypothetical protein
MEKCTGILVVYFSQSFPDYFWNFLSASWRCHVMLVIWTHFLIWLELLVYRQSVQDSGNQITYMYCRPWNFCGFKSLSVLESAAIKFRVCYINFSFCTY